MSRTDDSGRPRLPHNTTAEQSILGGILLRNDVIDRLEWLEPRHFFDLRNRLVFEAVRNLQARRRAIDVVSLELEIDKLGKLDAVGGIAYLGELVLCCPTPDNVVEYAQAIRRHHLIREVMVAAASAVQSGANFIDDPDEFLVEHIAGLQRILDDHGVGAEQRIPLIGPAEALAELAEIAAAPRFSTPWDAVNNAIGFGGLLGGQVYFLIGGTGAGKTSFVCQLVRHVSAEGGAALIATYEMPAGYYVARMTAPILGLPSNDIIDGRVNGRDVRAAYPDRAPLLDRPSMQTLRAAISKLIDTTGRPPLVVIDYLQELAAAIMARQLRPDPRLAVAQASTEVRAIAKDTGAAVVVVSAAGRSSARKLTSQEVRKLSPVELIDSSRESGQVEFDGAAVIVLSTSDDIDGDETIATITVAKARFGTRCHIDARFHGTTGAWRALGRVVQLPAGVTSASSTAAVNAIRADIVRVLRHAGPQRTRNAISKLVGRNRQAVLSEIDAMIDDGSAVFESGSIALAGAKNAAQPTPDAASQLPLSGSEPAK